LSIASNIINIVILIIQRYSFITTLFLGPFDDVITKFYCMSTFPSLLITLICIILHNSIILATKHSELEDLERECFRQGLGSSSDLMIPHISAQARPPWNITGQHWSQYCSPQKRNGQQSHIGHACYYMFLSENTLLLLQCFRLHLVWRSENRVMARLDIFFSSRQWWSHVCSILTVHKYFTIKIKTNVICFQPRLFLLLSFCSLYYSWRKVEHRLITS
jgi:hypothetical protein